MKQLVLCADDFALQSGASQGIAALAQQGCLTATSAMVLSPHWPRDAALLAPLRGRIDVGLHLDWTSEFSRSAGHGMSLPRALLATGLGQISPAEARPVIERQLQAFEQVWQAPPDHVDGHQHVQQFPGIRQALVAVLAERYGQAQPAPYLRISKLPLGQADFKARIIAATGAEALRRLARRHGLPSAPALAGVYGFDEGPPSYAKRMQAWLSSSPAGTLLMCHPAQSLDTRDEIGPARLREFSHLGSAEFQGQLRNNRIELVRGKQLYSL